MECKTKKIKEHHRKYKLPESDAKTVNERCGEDEKFCLAILSVINSGDVKEDYSKGDSAWKKRR